MAHVKARVAHPKLKLVGKDGNAFSIMGRARDAAKKAGWTQEEIDLYMVEARSGDYNDLLAVTMEHFDVS